MVKGQDFDQLLAGQYRQVLLNFLAKWANVIAGQIVLKTDLFAEALSPSRAFLWDMLQTNSIVIGIDVSGVITYRGRKNAAKYALDSSAAYVNCDA
ncbi:hypothetical protein ACFLV6_03100 [Chloroflexota bacterium]